MVQNGLYSGAIWTITNLFHDARGNIYKRGNGWTPSRNMTGLERGYPLFPGRAFDKLWRNARASFLKLTVGAKKCYLCGQRSLPCFWQGKSKTGSFT